jgi:hypothetical protein
VTQLRDEQDIADRGGFFGATRWAGAPRRAHKGCALAAFLSGLAQPLARQ